MSRRCGKVPEDPRLRYWGDFFVRAQLFPFIQFGEFMRDPEGIVASLTDPDQPPPAAMPSLRARIAEFVAQQPMRLAA